MLLLDACVLPVNIMQISIENEKEDTKQKENAYDRRKGQPGETGK